MNDDNKLEDIKLKGLARHIQGLSHDLVVSFISTII